VTSEGRRRTKTSRKILSSPENSLSFPVRHRRAKTKMGQYKRVRFINCLAPHKEVHVLKIAGRLFHDIARNGGVAFGFTNPLEHHKN